MADPQTRIILTADDRTKAAFASATNNIKSMTREAASLRASLGGIAGGLGVGAFAAFVKHTIDAADALNDMSIRSGVAVKDLAALKTAAEQNGTSLDAVAKGMQRLQVSIGEAQLGTKEYAEALTRLGVTAKDPREALFQLADAVKQSNDPTKTAADLQKVLSRNYVELLPLLKQGSEELRKSAGASESFAEAMAKAAPLADQFNDELAKLRTDAAGASAVLVTDLMPALKGLLAVALGVNEAFFEVGSSIGASAAAAAAAARGNFSEAGNIMSSLFEDLEKRQAAFSTRMEDLFAAAPKSVIDAGAGAFDLDRVLPGKSARPGKSTKPLTMQDALGTGSYFATDPATIKFIEEQQSAINALNGEMAADKAEAANNFASALQSLLADTDIAKTAEFQKNVDLLNQAFFDGVIGAEQYAQAMDNLTGTGMQGNIKTTKTLAEELNTAFESAFTKAISGGEDFQDVLKGLTAKVVELIAQTYILDRLFKSTKEGGLSTSGSSSGFSFDLGSLFSNGFGNGQNLLGDFASLFGFANGGVMTSAGPLPLARYANGGIANSPQFALFGEGSRPEAFVPLPDGRRIPVEMHDGGGKVINQIVNITAANPTEVRLSRGAMAADFGNAMRRLNRHM